MKRLKAIREPSHTSRLQVILGAGMQDTDIYNNVVNKNYSRESKNMHILLNNAIKYKFEKIYIPFARFCELQFVGCWVSWSIVGGRQRYLLSKTIIFNKFSELEDSKVKILKAKNFG